MKGKQSLKPGGGQLEYYQNALDKGSIPDEENPIAILQTVPAALLVKIASKEVDISLLAGYELQERGLDKEGKWVGFEQAERLWKAREYPAPSVKRRGRRL